MSDSDHPQNLADFLAGALSEAEEDEIIAHVGDCEPCLIKIDELWQERLSWPSFDPANAERVERRLLKTINLSNLGGRALQFGTTGMMNTYLKMMTTVPGTWLGLLGPLFVNKKSSKDKDNDRA